MKPECPFGALVTDFAAGELADAVRRETESHLRECDECAQALVAHRHFIASLRSLPMPEASLNLTPQVFAAIREHLHKTAGRSFIPLGLAAAVTLISFLPFIRRSPAPVESVAVLKVAEAPATSLERAIHWLCANQHADGSWDAEKWGGNRSFKVALTALPTIAVLSKGSPSEERAAVAARAVNWLRAQQAENGTFGPQNFGMPYNHSIATLALLHAYRLHKDPDLKQSIDSALIAMMRAQGRDGGWGWQGGSTSDSVITAWHIEALQLANELGVGNLKSALDRGLAWTLTHPDPCFATASRAVELTGIETRSPTVIGPDLCSAYFLATALQRRNDEASRQRLTAIRQDLVQNQIPNGSESGSWSPDDQWARTGGRIYTTALASLSLEDL